MMIAKARDEVFNTKINFTYQQVGGILGVLMDNVRALKEKP
jgi:hypothetical protein